MTGTLVIVTADFCGPCRAFKATQLEALKATVAKEFPGMAVEHFNVDLGKESTPTPLSAKQMWFLPQYLRSVASLPHISYYSATAWAGLKANPNAGPAPIMVGAMGMPPRTGGGNENIVNRAVVMDKDVPRNAQGIAAWLAMVMQIQATQVRAQPQPTQARPRASPGVISAPRPTARTPTGRVTPTPSPVAPTPAVALPTVARPAKLVRPTTATGVRYVLTRGGNPIVATDATRPGSVKVASR